MKRLQLELKITWKQLGVITALAGIILTFYLLPPILFPSSPATGQQLNQSIDGCQDTDGGLLPSIKGTCTDDESYTDTCLTTHVLGEYACNAGLCIRKSLNCDTIGTRCEDGICVPIKEEEPTPLPNESTTNVKLPDLVISSINQYTTNVSGDNGTRNLTVYIDIALENNGNSPAPVTITNVSLTGPIDLFGYINSPIVYDGRLQILNMSFNVGNTTGTYNVQAVADVHQYVAEADENNNVREIQFVVS